MPSPDPRLVNEIIDLLRDHGVEAVEVTLLVLQSMTARRQARELQQRAERVRRHSRFLVWQSQHRRGMSQA